MARFSDVPLDVLPYILEHLSQLDFNNLVRICKSFRKEVVPWLYKDITITATPTGNSSLRIECFLRTLIERPLLASHTRVFKIAGTHNCWGKSSRYELRTSSKPALWGLEKCKCLSWAQLVSESKRLERILDPALETSAPQFQGRSKDTLMALILLRLNNLTTLRVSDGFVTYSFFLAHILKKLDSLLPHLNHIALGDRKQDPANCLTYIDLNLIRPIFYASNIRTFEAAIFEPWRFHWNSPEPPKALRLSSLHIHRTNISLNMLSQLLSVTPRLKSFHYEQGIHVKNYRLNRHAGLLHYNDLNGMDTVLHNISGTLEELQMSIHLADNYTCDVSPSTGPSVVGPVVLKTMNHLRNLNLPMLMLLGWPTDQLIALEDVLPASIEELSISDDLVVHCPWGVGAEVRPKIRLIGEYMEGRQIAAPEIRALTINFRDEHKEAWWLADAVRDLRAWVNADDVQYLITHEAGAETHLWRFQAAGT